MSVIATVLVFVLFLYSVIAHEVAHGWVALRCGDPTARNAGRLTANPLPHLDPWMSLAFPLLTWLATGGGVILGAARPVPVMESRLRRWPRDAVLVALAGVAVNLAIAAVCAITLDVVGPWRPEALEGLWAHVVFRTALVNLGLFVFNLLPIPPLDGSRVLRFALKGEARAAYERLEPFGMIILVAFLMIGGNAIGDAVHFLARLLFAPLQS